MLSPWNCLTDIHKYFHHLLTPVNELTPVITDKNREMTRQGVQLSITGLRNFWAPTNVDKNNGLSKVARQLQERAIYSREMRPHKGMESEGEPWQGMGLGRSRLWNEAGWLGRWWDSPLERKDGELHPRRQGAGCSCQAYRWGETALFILKKINKKKTIVSPLRNRRGFYSWVMLQKCHRLSGFEIYNTTWER